MQQFRTESVERRSSNDFIDSVDFYYSKKTLIREGTWVLSGQIAAAMGVLVGVRLLTEFVPPEIYGVISLMLGIMTLGYNLFCFPTLQAVIRFYPDVVQAGSVGILRKTVRLLLLRNTGLLITTSTVLFSIR